MCVRYNKEPKSTLDTPVTDCGLIQVVNNQMSVLEK